MTGHGDLSPFIDKVCRASYLSVGKTAPISASVSKLYLKRLFFHINSFFFPCVDVGRGGLY
jgi:hypothetical protein